MTAFLQNRLLGAALMALGLWMLSTPLWVGEWALALLAIPMMVAGVFKLVSTFRQRLPAKENWTDYGQGLLLMASGPFLLAAPGLAIANVRNALTIYLLVAACLSLIEAWQHRNERWVLFDIVTAAASVMLALLIRTIGTDRSIVIVGLVAGFALITVGWRMSFAAAPLRDEDQREVSDRHLDAALDLPGHPVFLDLHRRYATDNSLRSPETWRWTIYFLLTLFSIHAVRMGANFSAEGLIPSLAATLGDVLIAVAVFWLIIAPMRLVWRRISRGIERRLWLARLDAQPGARRAISAPVQRLVNLWLDGRYAFALNFKRSRASILDGFSLAVGQGLIIAALLVAINSIWGFSWYFNTENWASGIYQAVTGPRVDIWRNAMTDAVLTRPGIDPQRAFEVRPVGVATGADFSFIVIGDPGEGDASQASLKDRYLELAQRDDVKFVVISSDVIYPAGEMKDYERNFYLPFKGVRKPIYAIPGNHDWFNALAGFSANFMRPDTARAAIDARIAVDRGLTLMDGKKRDAMIAEATRLRQEYRLDTGLQNAPYFEIQTDDFALLAIDTGVLQSIDPGQERWLDDALRRARGKFVMAITGHPRFAGGQDMASEATPLRKLFDRLEAGGVSVAMAGDTHDFEYYRQETKGGARPIHHFLNGGGGAYLSIGTALDWPKQPATTDWAYYPSTEAVQAKLARETPLWKKPALWWINAFKAWPVSVETLSGIFDFNKAPFFQSFVEVRIAPSRNEASFILHGVNGVLRWKDLNYALPASQISPDAEVVFRMPLRP